MYLWWWLHVCGLAPSIRRRIAVTRRIFASQLRPHLTSEPQKIDPKTHEAFENVFSPLNICKDTAEVMMKTHYGDSDPGPGGHIRVIKRYCQLEHDGPSYTVDLRTGQITVLSH
jgi:hypothetical protein